VASSGTDAAVEPDWLIVGLELRLWPESDDPGETPDQTALYAEGCADVQADALLEAWVRHTLVGINRWTDEGTVAIHTDWRGLAYGIGETAEVAGKSGTFLGVDERFGMLLRDADDTHLIPLTHLLENG
jgi:biotin-(acetyl-CoA carboxylase) ligase